MGGGGAQVGGEQRLRIGVQQVGHSPSGWGTGTIRQPGTALVLGTLGTLHSPRVGRTGTTVQPSAALELHYATLRRSQGLARDRDLSSATAIRRAAEAMGSRYGTDFAKKR